MIRTHGGGVKMLQLFKSTFHVTLLPDADWEALRLSLLQRSLRLLLPFLVLYVLATALLDQTVLPSVAGLVFVVMVLMVLQQHSDARRFLTWVLGLATLALLQLAVQLWQAPGIPPALMIVALLGALGLFMDGPALGWLLLLGGIGMNLWALRHAPSGDYRAITAGGLQIGLGIGLFVSAWGWQRGLRLAQRELQQANRRLLQQRDDRQVLSLALFHELRLAEQRLQQALGLEGAVDWARVNEQALAMQAQATQIRSLRNSFQDEPAIVPARTDFDRGVMLAILLCSFALAAAGFGSALLQGRAGSWAGPLTMGLMACGLFSLRKGRPVPAWLACAVVLIGPLILVSDQAQHWGRSLALTLGFWCLSILNAALLLSWRVALGLAVAATALIFGALLALPAAGPAEWHWALSLLLSFALVGAICLQAVVWQQSVIHLLERGRVQLSQGLAQRRRLLGTLFHDLANPLAALLALSGQGRAGMAVPGDLERSRRLARRMGELLQDNQAWLLGESGAVSAELPTVPLPPVLAGMLDLFQDRLAAKRLVLNVEVASDAKALAQPAVLRDSVLSNLLSNAIKFSRAGSVLELQAFEQDGQACIELRDRGPGLEAGLRERLAQGLDLPSRPGTQGEPGQGLGLALVREHLLRMGGSLELQDREGGGLVARLRLRLA